jgi:uncharacterized membrane protein
MRWIEPAIAKRAGCLAAWLALAAGPAAAVPGDPFDMRAVCRADFERFCRDLGTEASRADIERCLATHDAELSPACRIAVGEASAAKDEPLPAPGQRRPGSGTTPTHP